MANTVPSQMPQERTWREVFGKAQAKRLLVDTLSKGQKVLEHVKYVPEVIHELLIRYASGESIRAICTDEHMPRWMTIYEWRNKHPEFRESWERANMIRADLLAERVVDIIDDAVDRDSAAAVTAKLKAIELATRNLNRAKYGVQRTEISGVDGKPIQVDAQTIISDEQRVRRAIDLGIVDKLPARLLEQAKTQMALEAETNPNGTH